MDKDTLYRFFKGSCTEDEVHRVRVWVESSAENEKTFYDESKMFDAIGLVGSPDMIAKQKKTIYRRTFIREVLKIASVVILFVLGTSIYNYYSNRNMADNLTTINVPAGKNVNIILPDGSIVWLNARSKLQYASNFNDKRREVILDGEGYFDVKKNTGKPFIVHTKKYDVEVHGTSFNVEAYSFEDRFVTSLLTGLVKIVPTDDSSNSILLKPNTLAYAENGKLKSKRITDYDVYRWKEGLICFDNIPFSDVMKEFEKQYEIKIIIENDHVKSYFCTGKFRQTDGVEYALRVLQKDARFSYSREDGSNIIIIN